MVAIVRTPSVTVVNSAAASVEPSEASSEEDSVAEDSAEEVDAEDSCAEDSELLEVLSVPPQEARQRADTSAAEKSANIFFMSNSFLSYFP